MAYEQALQAREAVELVMKERYKAVTLALKAAIGRRNPTLASYGIAPDKVPASLTTEEQQTRLAKARATRVARGTKGKRQKLAIKGDTREVTSPPAQASTAATTAGH